MQLANCRGWPGHVKYLIPVRAKHGKRDCGRIQMADSSNEPPNLNRESSDSSSESYNSGSESSDSSNESHNSSSESHNSGSELSDSSSESYNFSTEPSDSSGTNFEIESFASDSSAELSDSGAELSDSSESIDHLKYQQYWYLGDRVSEGFRHLISKYSPNTIHRRNQSSFDVEVNSKQVLLDRLESSLLPLLRQQITALSRLLSPSVLMEDPGTKLQLLLEMQPELERTIDQIISIVNTVFPELVSTANRADDQHLGRLKSYRLQYLKIAFLDDEEGFLTELGLISRRAYRLIQEMKLSSKKLARSNSHEIYRSWLDTHVQYALLSINSAIVSLSGSDLDVAQDFWPAELSAIERRIWSITANANLPPTMESNGQLGARSFTRKPALQLAKLSIPIMKLSRIFFLKTSKRGLNSKGLPFFTNMSSVQIQTLADSIKIVDGELDDFYSQLNADNTDDLAIISRELLDTAARLKNYLDIPMVLLLFHFVHTKDFPDKDYYHSWLCDWHSLFQFAINKFINAVELLITDQL
ncbi:hypothetical protein PTTG_08999 [Puccinia triticina 1-1 BBBD Race 1]|uniref:Uncharacterized protein n=1 Tax=Puccinia triticina (isolate 1-1 / race 1 (BBBD)) TaxID=630390 RepID=A0A180GK97_PUCT1|nr:hypothetical protein PTTG_08999 [Puccinia triticina 1-1 BBBD Race 1]WAR62186.1 hypothetical protein PtB15_14B280 [Puccinia triticina]